MRTIEHDVTQHYSHGSLVESILTGLQALGQTSGDAVEQLAPVDEFHIGGREATHKIADQLQLAPGLAILDIGCGIGGTARFFAARYGCRVTGIDLTPEFVDTARTLSERVGLADRVEFHVGSAVALPFPDASFDRATVLHVGMNIPDKWRLCAELARVVKPGALVAVYDVMRAGAAPLAFPVPWSTTESTSFVEPPETYRTALHEAGFEIRAEHNRAAFAGEFFKRMRARVAESGPPPLGLHIIMGANASMKVANMIDNIDRGAIAPIEMIAQRTEGV
jgi:SAM-dependent methyltransferase